jgi:uncharacterized protein (TIGR00251 family)
MNLKEYIKFENNIWFAKIKVTPKSSKSEFFSVLDDWTLKIRIKAVPENWKANKELISFLAKEFSVKKQNIEIVSWQTEQVKRVKIVL